MRTDRKDHETLLERFTLLPGISGHEQLVAGALRREIGDRADSIKTDGIGNTLFTFDPAIRNIDTSGKGNIHRDQSSRTPRLLVAAHMDEVGFIISDILPSGFLRLHPIGGWNPVTIPAIAVEIITSDGNRIHGIVGSIPPHALKESGTAGQVPSIESLFIDIGAVSAESVTSDYGIRLGDPVVPLTSFAYHGRSGIMMSKAFDDRAGIAALAALARRLHDESGRLRTQAVVQLAATVQEEVGVRGARVLSHYVDADAALIVEGVPADDIPGSGGGNPQTCVGKGAHVRIYDPGMIADRSFLELIRMAARRNDIPVQETVRRTGGTDGREIHLASRGIPTVVVGVPVRYPHSSNCLMSLDDFDALIDLLETVCVSFTGPKNLPIDFL